MKCKCTDNNCCSRITRNTKRKCRNQGSSYRCVVRRLRCRNTFPYTGTKFCFTRIAVFLCLICHKRRDLCAGSRKDTDEHTNQRTPCDRLVDPLANFPRREDMLQLLLISFQILHTKDLLHKLTESEDTDQNRDDIITTHQFVHTKGQTLCTGQIIRTCTCKQDTESR